MSGKPLPHLQDQRLPAKPTGLTLEFRRQPQFGRRIELRQELIDEVLGLLGGQINRYLLHRPTLSLLVSIRHL